MRLLPLLLPALLWFATTHADAGEASAAGQAGAPQGAATSSVAARELAAVRAAVSAAEQRRAQAVASRDVAALRTMISGDYYHVETGGRARTKTEFLQLLTRDEFEFRSYEVDDHEIRMFDNGRAALVTGRFRAEFQGAGPERELRGRYVRMWVLGPEGWRNTLHQSTEIRPAAVQREAGAKQ